MTDVRIFKLLSGEMVIGKLKPDPNAPIPAGSSTPLQKDLHELKRFVISSPMLLQYNAQGFGLAPIYPWANPTEGAVAIFEGRCVLAEADLFDPVHSDFVKQYEQIISPIQIASPLVEGLGVPRSPWRN